MKTNKEKDIDFLRKIQGFYFKQIEILEGGSRRGVTEGNLTLGFSNIRHCELCRRHYNRKKSNLCSGCPFNLANERHSLGCVQIAREFKAYFRVMFSKIGIPDGKEKALFFYRQAIIHLDYFISQLENLPAKDFTAKSKQNKEVIKIYNKLKEKAK